MKKILIIEKLLAFEKVLLRHPVYYLKAVMSSSITQLKTAFGYLNGVSVKPEYFQFHLILFPYKIGRKHSSSKEMSTHYSSCMRDEQQKIKMVYINFSQLKKRKLTKSVKPRYGVDFFMT